MSFTTKIFTFPSAIPVDDLKFKLQAGEKRDELDALQGAITERINALGGSPDGPEGRDSFNAKVHKDVKWLSSTRRLIQILLNKELPDEYLARLIYKPEWAGLRLKTTEVSYGNDGEVITALAPDHAYTTQILEHDVDCVDTPSSSVGGFVVGSDGKSPICLRGGMRYRDVHHMTHAGYLPMPGEGWDGVKHPFVVNLEARLADEMGLSPGQVEASDLLGFVITNSFQDKGTIDFVFASRTTLDSSEVEAAHQGSEANKRGEYQRLIFLAADKMVQWVNSAKIYDRELADPENPHATTDGNKDSLMPHGALAMIAMAEKNGVPSTDVDAALASLNARTNQAFDMRVMADGETLSTRTLLSA